MKENYHIQFQLDMDQAWENNTFTRTMRVQASGLSDTGPFSMKRLLEIVPVETGMKYLPVCLLPDAVQHNANQDENRDYLYQNFAAGEVPDGLEVYSQSDGELIWVCRVLHCDMGMRAEIPNDLTVLSMLYEGIRGNEAEYERNYAGISLVPDENGELNGSVTVQYSFYHVK